MIRAVIFDIDGTLIDSVDFHAQAWQDAFRDSATSIPFDDVRARSARGATSSCRSSSRRRSWTRRQGRSRSSAVELFEARVPAARPRRSRRVRELFERIKADGKRIALASSAKADELETLQEDRRHRRPGRRRERPRRTTPRSRSRTPTSSRPRWRSSGHRPVARRSSSATPLTTPRPRARPACRPSASSAAASPKPTSARPAASPSTATRPICWSTTTRLPSPDDRLAPRAARMVLHALRLN